MSAKWSASACAPRVRETSWKLKVRVLLASLANTTRAFTLQPPRHRAACSAGTTTHQFDPHHMLVKLNGTELPRFKHWHTHR